MKRSILLIFIFFLFTLPASSQYYFGGGPQYMLPLSDYETANDPDIGFTIHYDMRQWCKFWYGLRLDYFSPEQSDDLLPGQDYFEDFIYISPNFRYNFLGNDCRSYNFVPYVQGMLTFSSITGSDELGSFGIGGAAGLGMAYSFSVFDLCWMLDLNTLYSAPNFIIKDEDRETIQSANVSLTLSVRL